MSLNAYQYVSSSFESSYHMPFMFLMWNQIVTLVQNISMRLVDQVNVTDPFARSLRQRIVVESGRLLFNFGSSLLALGHATSRISMGDTQVCNI